MALATPSPVWLSIADYSEIMKTSIGFGSTSGNIINDDGHYIDATNPCSTSFGSGCNTPLLSTIITQEGIGTLGSVNVQSLYYDTVSQLAVGDNKTLNFNIFEDSSHSLLSDTLSISFTGTPNDIIPGSLINTRLNVNFLSDSLDDMLPVMLTGTNVFNITETGGYVDLSSYINGAGLRDAHVRFLSDVPEPATLTLMSIGLAGMAFSKRRKQANGKDSCVVRREVV